jgi:poly [ADP-ribose] polymerase
VKDSICSGDNPDDWVEIVSSIYELYNKNNLIIKSYNRDSLKMAVDQHSRKTCELVLPYDCTLNQTDLKTNKNKFYIMQVLKEGTQYYTYVRYGRIGEVGKISYNADTNPDNCIAYFIKQFRDKTKNDWNKRDNFKQFPEKYYLCDKQTPVDTVVSSDVTSLGSSTIIQKPLFTSSLNPKIIEFMELIGNISMLQTTLRSLNVDIKKMPLGAIAPEQLNKAESVLKNIQSRLQLGGITGDELMNMSSEYYTYIPLSSGRVTRPPVINTVAMVDTYRQNIDELRNLKIAYSAIQEDSTPKEHPADHLYKGLDTEIEVLDETDPMRQAIMDYVKNTHGTTHLGTGRIQVIEIYRIKRNNDNKRLDLTGNRHLLWHGTRLSNYISILKNGLVLRPELIASGVSITGKMFGYGIYGANSFSKSYNYCNPVPDEDTCLLLGEFSLGKVLELTQEDYYLNKETLKTRGGFNSTWGQGMWTPSSTMEIGTVKVPNGKLTRASVNGASLNYDEFIVYDEKQIKLKYIVRVRST